jgi:arylsulfatase
MNPQENLPFTPTPSASIAGRTLQESVYAQRQHPKRLPDDAPNILIVIIDDVGPGLPTTYGGEVRTDTLSRIHNEGTGYNRFHTTAMCSPTRSSLLTGRNHHRIGNGQISEAANDWDGYAGEIPRSSALRGGAEGLRLPTAAFGKWHNTPAIEQVLPGPSRTGRPGSVRVFLRVLAGEASHYEPNLVRNTTGVLPPRTPEEATTSEDSPRTPSAGSGTTRRCNRTRSSCTGRVMMHGLTTS